MSEGVLIGLRTSSRGTPDKKVGNHWSNGINVIFGPVQNIEELTMKKQRRREETV